MMKALKDVTTKIGSGATPRGGQEAYHAEGISLIRSQNVLDFDFSYNGLAFIDDDQAYKLKNVIVEKNDVLLNITGDSVARVCKVPDEVLPARVNQHVAIIRPNPKKLDFDYLLYYLLNPPFKKYMLKIASDGATRNAITKVDIEEFEIVAPENVADQKQIATILSTLDKKTALLKKQNQTLEELAQTLFKRWFVDFEFPNEQGKPYKSTGGKMIASELGEIPEGWSIGIFADIILFSNGYAFKSSDLLSDKESDCFNVFKMANIRKGGGFIADKTKSYIPKKNCIGLDKYVLKKGDLLMSMTDMKDNVSLLGHTALMPVDNKYIVNQRVGLIRSQNIIGIEFPFLYLLTNSRLFLAEIRSKANSGVQVNLSTEGIKNSNLVIPSEIQNKQFNNAIQPSFEKIAENELEIKNLKSLRDTLLPKLMSGNIKVSDINI